MDEKELEERRSALRRRAREYRSGHEKMILSIAITLLVLAVIAFAAYSSANTTKTAPAQVETKVTAPTTKAPPTTTQTPAQTPKPTKSPAPTTPPPTTSPPELQTPAPLTLPAPTIRLTSPENTTYNMSTPSLEFIVAGSNLDSVLLSVDGGANITVPHDGTIAKIEFAGSRGAWRFDENANSTVYDVSGNANTGTIYGATWWVDGKDGKALSFDGVDDYVDLPYVLSPTAQPFTIAAWVKTNTLTQPEWERGIVLKRTTKNSWSLHQRDDGRFGFVVWKDGSTTWTVVTPPISTGVWYFLVATYNGENTIKFYLDAGTPSSSSGVTGIQDNPDPTTNKIRIGWGGDPNRFFNGTIDDVLIFDRALSATEVALLYSSGYPLPDGAHNLTIFANNSAGNVSTQTIFFTVNATAAKAEEEKIGGMREALTKGGFEVTLKRFDIRKEISVYPSAYMRSQYGSSKIVSALTLT